MQATTGFPQRARVQAARGGMECPRDARLRRLIAWFALIARTARRRCVVDGARWPECRRAGCPTAFTVRRRVVGAGHQQPPPPAGVTLCGLACVPAPAARRNDRDAQPLGMRKPRVVHLGDGARRTRASPHVRRPAAVCALPQHAGDADPGDHDMPRVQDGSFGASERFAVVPGREAEGYLHIAGGQSGHPMSPYYSAGFTEWAEGKPLPFLPGAAEHVLTLNPAPLSPP